MGFTDFFVRWFGGIPGKTLFDMLIKNQLQVTLIVIVYGTILTIASYNFKKAIPGLTHNFVRSKALSIMDKEKNMPIEKVSSIVYEEWLKMIDNLPKYLFIPNEKDYWVILPNGRRFAKRLNIDEMYIKNIIKTI